MITQITIEPASDAAVAAARAHAAAARALRLRVRRGRLMSRWYAVRARRVPRMRPRPVLPRRLHQRQWQSVGERVPSGLALRAPGKLDYLPEWLCVPLGD